MSSGFEDEDFGDFEGFDGQSSVPTAGETKIQQPVQVTIEDVEESDEEFAELQVAAGVSTSPLKTSAKYQCAEDDPVLSEVSSEFPSLKTRPAPAAQSEKVESAEPPTSTSKSFGGLDDNPIVVPSTPPQVAASFVEIDANHGNDDDEFGEFGQFEGSPIPPATTSEPAKEDLFNVLDGTTPKNDSNPSTPVKVVSIVTHDDPFSAFDEIATVSQSESIMSSGSEKIDSSDTVVMQERSDSNGSSVKESKVIDIQVDAVDNIVPPNPPVPVASMMMASHTIVEDDPFAAFDDLLMPSTNTLPAQVNTANNIDLLDIAASEPQPTSAEGLDPYGQLETPTAAATNDIASPSMDLLVGGLEDMKPIDVSPPANNQLNSIEDVDSEEFGQFEATPVIASETQSAKTTIDVFGGLDETPISAVNSTPSAVVNETKATLNDDPFGAFDEIGTSTKSIEAEAEVPSSPSKAFVGGLDEAVISSAIDGLHIYTPSKSDNKMGGEDEEFGDFGQFEASPLPPAAAPSSTSSSISPSAKDPAFIALDEPMMISTDDVISSAMPSMSMGDNSFSVFDVIVDNSSLTQHDTDHDNTAHHHLLQEQEQQPENDFGEFGQFESTPAIQSEDPSMKGNTDDESMLIGDLADNNLLMSAPPLSQHTDNPVPSLEDSDPFAAFDEIGNSTKVLVQEEASASSKGFVGLEDSLGVLDTNNNGLPISTTSKEVQEVDEFGDFGEFESTPVNTESEEPSVKLVGDLADNLLISTPPSVVNPMSSADLQSAEVADFVFEEMGNSTKIEEEENVTSPSKGFVGGLEEGQIVKEDNALHISTPSKETNNVDEEEEEDFGDFGRFEASPLPSKASKETAEMSEPIQPPSVSMTDGDEFGDFGDFEASPLPDTTNTGVNEGSSLQLDAEPSTTVNAMVSEDSSSGSSSSWQVVDTPTATASQSQAPMEGIVDTMDDDDFGDFAFQSPTSDSLTPPPSTVAVDETPATATIPVSPPKRSEENLFDDDEDFGDFGDFVAPTNNDIPKETPEVVSNEVSSSIEQPVAHTSASEDPFGFDTNAAPDEDDFDDFVDGNNSSDKQIVKVSGAVSTSQVEDDFGPSADDDFGDFGDFSSPTENKSNPAVAPVMAPAASSTKDDFFGDDKNVGGNDDDWDAFAEAPSSSTQVAPVAPAASVPATSSAPTASFAAFDDKSNDDEWDAFDSTPAASTSTFEAFSSPNAAAPTTASLSSKEFSINTGNLVIDKEVLSLRQLSGANNTNNDFYSMFGEMSLLASGLFPTDSTSTTIRSDATLSTIGSEVLQFDSAWLDNIFDGNVPSTLESAPLSPWYTETIEKILSEHIPATACSIEELKHKIENDSLKTNYLAAKNRQIQGRRIASSEMVLNRSESNQEVKVTSHSDLENTARSTTSSKNSTDWDAFGVPPVGSSSSESANSSRNNSERRPSVQTAAVPIVQLPNASVKTPPSNSQESELSKAATDFLRNLPDLSYIFK